MTTNVTSQALPVGRILRSDTIAYTVGSLVLETSLPHAGSFVRTQSGPGTLIGVIENVSVEDDPFVRQLIAADTPEEIILDQRQRRLVPIEVSVIHVGIQPDGGRYYHHRPSQPPAVLEQIFTFSGSELAVFTANLGYVRLLLDYYGGRAEGDEIIASAILTAANQRKDANERYRYLVAAGQTLARRLPHDLLRLDMLLQRIHPG